VVGLTLLKRRSAENTSPVAHNQRQKLSRRCVSMRSAQPQRSAIQTNNHRCQIAGCHQLGQKLIAYGTAADLRGGTPSRAVSG